MTKPEQKRGSEISERSFSAELENRPSCLKTYLARKVEASGSEDTVKFDAEIPDLAEMLTNSHGSSEEKAVIKDETLLLFNCMPKGLESFLETGPSRRVVDYMDYEKLCEIQTKKIEYLQEQKIPQANRAKDIFEKSLELQDHFKNFDVFVTDARKKRLRADAYYTSCKNANRDLDIEMPRAVKELKRVKEIRDHLMMKVIKYQPVDDFIESVIKLPDTQFLTFHSIMDRSSTLKSTNKYLARRFTERHVIEKQLSEELQAVNNVAKTHDIFIRREINRLKKELQGLTRSNMDLEQKCNKWSEMTIERVTNVYLMKSSIKNMARTIMRVRPFTAKSMEGLTNPCDMLEHVGLFVTNYAHIVSAPVILESKSKRKNMDKSRANIRNEIEENAW